MKSSHQKISAMLKQDFDAASLSRKSLAEIITAVTGKKIRPAFSGAASRRLLLKKQPALQFEKQNGLNGIAGQYTMPENVRPFDLERVLVKAAATVAALPLYADLWERLEAANPELKNISIQPEDPLCMDYALMGVVSGFNVDDINFFLKGHKEGIPSYTYSQSPPRFKRLYKEITQRTGGINWIPAPATLEKIKSQLDKRDKEKRLGL